MFNLGFTIFRECLEASILIGIITASLAHVEKFRIYLASGIMLGVCAASFVSFFAKSLLITYALGDDILCIVIISFTILMLIWTIIFVQNYEHKIKRKIKNMTEHTTLSTVNKAGVVLVIGSTIFREAVEIMLFAYGVAASHKLTATGYIVSLLIGCLSGISLGYGTYKGLVNIKIQYLFKVISVILTIITAALSAKLAGILNASGLILIGNRKIWDTSMFISNEGLIGKLLDVLIGYNAKPTWLQVTSYISVVIFITICVKLRNAYNKKHLS